METKVLEYKHGDLALEGYLALSGTAKDIRPGILVCHEWMGLGSYEKGRAQQLASAGYHAFAVDLYGKGVHPQTVDDAGREMNKIKSNRPKLRERMQMGIETLLQCEGVDRSRIAVIGYCFGGCAALELARSGAKISGAVTFHGALDTPMPAEPGVVKAKLLVFHGADDSMTTPEHVIHFQHEVKRAKIDCTLTQFSQTVHGFTNPKNGNDPSTGFAYNQEADLRSWHGMLAFLNEIFAA